jgi:hypothetical protein
MRSREGIGGAEGISEKQRGNREQQREYARSREGGIGRSRGKRGNMRGAERE